MTLVRANFLLCVMIILLLCLHFFHTFTYIRTQIKTNSLLTNRISALEINNKILLEENKKLNEHLETIDRLLRQIPRPEGRWE